MLIVYVDDAILISPNKDHIEFELASLRKSYELTDEGPLHDYLGTRFDREDGKVTLSQPRMINRILELVGLDPKDERTKRHDSPADSETMLTRDENGETRQQDWNYRAVVGCLSYLQAMVRPDITFAVQACARFCNDPKRSHEEAVKRICRYLLQTKDEGLVLKPDSTKGLECYVDADWAGPPPILVPVMSFLSPDVL